MREYNGSGRMEGAYKDQNQRAEMIWHYVSIAWQKTVERGASPEIFDNIPVNWTRKKTKSKVQKMQTTTTTINNS